MRVPASRNCNKMRLPRTFHAMLDTNMLPQLAPPPPLPPVLLTAMATRTYHHPGGDFHVGRHHAGEPQPHKVEAHAIDSRDDASAGVIGIERRNHVSCSGRQAIISAVLRL